MPRVACQSEFFVPMEHASSALQAVREIARCWPGWPTSEALEDLHRRIPVFHCEVRAIPADGLSGMSPFADRNTCSIHFTWGSWTHRTRILEMISEVESVIKPYLARPHFGKINLFSAADIAHAYSKESISGFLALCQRHDPEG